MLQDNPAARLLSILQAGKSKQSHLNTRDVWADLLDVDKSDDGKILCELGKFMGLPNEVDSLLDLHFPNAATDSMKHCLHTISGAFRANNLNDQWKLFIDKIDTHSIGTLSMGSAMLDTKLKAKLIEANELDRIRSQIQELIESVISTGEIEVQFQDDLVRYLSRILEAINSYKITGAVPIMEAMEATVGHASISPNFRDNLKKEGVGQQVVAVISALAQMVTVAVGAPDAIENVRNVTTLLLTTAQAPGI